MPITIRAKLGLELGELLQQIERKREGEREIKKQLYIVVVISLSRIQSPKEFSPPLSLFLFPCLSLSSSTVASEDRLELARSIRG